MSNTIDNPARLFVILARKAHRAVILRRGPHEWVRLILWHTDTDTFEPGQWLHGRIYARRCDLSPDGSLFIYFAAKHQNPYDSPYTYSWTAISKPPYLTALALWPKGDCWAGGGLFQTNDKVWLNHGSYRPHSDHLPKKALKIVINPAPCGEDFPIYGTRLVRDGWELVQAGNWTAGEAMIWHKQHPQQGYSIEMALRGYDHQRYGDPYIYEFALFTDDDVFPLENATWADWDQHGRLALTRDGQVFAVPPEAFRPDLDPVADLNDQQVEPIEAPGWARRW